MNMTRDEQKTKAELLQELDTLRERVSGLKQAVEQWSKTFDATPDLVFVQDKDCKFVKVNKSFCDVFKVKPEDLIGKKCYEVLHKSDKPWPNCPLAKTLKDKRQHQEELYDPNIGISLLINTSPLFDENGELTGAVHIAKDITERKKVEEALRESEGRYKTLFECAAEGIIVADTETKEFKYANPVICKMLGYTEEELGRLGVRDIHPKEDLQHIVSEFEAQARGEKTLSSSIPCLRKDGIIIYADINTAMVLVDGRQCNVGFFTDITERKRIKTDLENYKEKVLQAQKHAYISSIGAIVAHQVNQPLTTINMLLEKALELEQVNDNCCPPVLQRIEKSLTEAKKAASLIRKFHQYSRDPTLETTTNVNVSSTVNRIIFMLSERAEQAKINISTKSLDDLPEVEINETALEQLFLIIIQNAIEASDGRKKHRLNIGGGFAESKIELQFSDDCCGIAPENLDKIFEPFFSTKSDSKGIGLGLDIVQQILISYGGEIRVESQFGKSATFYVTLPISIL